MSLRPGKLPFLGREDEFLDHRGIPKLSIPTRNAELMVCELGMADQALPTILRERMSMMAVSQGRMAALVDIPENRSLRTQTSCWPWSETQIWLGTSDSKSVSREGSHRAWKSARASRVRRHT